MKLRRTVIWQSYKKFIDQKFSFSFSLTDSENFELVSGNKHSLGSELLNSDGREKLEVDIPEGQSLLGPDISWA